MPAMLNDGANFRMPFDQLPAVMRSNGGAGGNYGGWGSSFGGFGAWGNIDSKIARIKRKIEKALAKHKAKKAARLREKLKRKKGKQHRKADRKARNAGGSVAEAMAYDPNAPLIDPGAGDDGSMELADDGDSAFPSWAYWVGGGVAVIVLLALMKKGG